MEKGRPTTGQVKQVNDRWVSSWFWVSEHTGLRPVEHLATRATRATDEEEQFYLIDMRGH